MPRPLFRRKSSPHSASSLLRYLFPRTSARARAQLFKFRHETLATLKHRTQSRIYRYIVRRQALKLRKAPSIFQRFRAETRKLVGRSYLENAAKLRRHQLTQASKSEESNTRAMSYQDSYAPREPGARRRKFAGYLKAANELRQTYQQQYTSNWNKREAAYNYEDDTPGSFPDAAIVRSGEEEMILFPSYARKHVKRKPEAEPGTIQEYPGEGRDARDTTGAGDAEFWKQQWDQYEDDNAVVDVDVRGWIYSPHKGQMSRKQRLFIGLARQLVGIQASAAGVFAQSASPSPNNSRDPSPSQTGHRERAQVRQAQRDEFLTAREAEDILRRGEKEAELAAQGVYSEKPTTENDDDTQVYRTESRDSLRREDSKGSLNAPRLSHVPSNSSLRSEDTITSVQKRALWNQPADMGASELAEANARLMARLRHFLAIPMANTPISVFFYNDKISKQRTIYTNPSGHFSITAALDFVPTHVRILASEELSATEEIIVTEAHGVSVISDIDDTIKHSAISSGAREIFRNAFIRELGDLTIEGVKEWYNRMAEMGVKFHYVSNSPWQLFPVISKYFTLAGLPPGSFHLKQYSGMLQGIFEPVAERKKSTLDKIARDFPERRFILIGDSGEADLEVYTDFVLENPGRVVAVFIRDVTTTEGGGFFDPSIGPITGDRSSPPSQARGTNSSGSTQSRGQPSSVSDEHDPELRAAIQASLRHMDEENQRRTKSLFPKMDEDHPELRPRLPPRNGSQPTPPPEPVTNLIDLSSEGEQEPLPGLRRANTDTKTETLKHRASVASNSSAKSAPPPPRKPVALRSGSGDSSSSPNTSKAPPPPKPRNPSSTVNQPSPLSQRTSAPTGSPAASKSSRPAIAPKPNFQTDPQQQTYAGMARDKLVSVYNNLPSFYGTNPQDELNYAGATSHSSHTTQNTDGTKKAPPPPPPPRRGITAYPAQAASYVGSKASSAWQHAPSVPHPPIPYHSRPGGTSQAQAQQFSTTSGAGYPNRTNTSSTLGANGNNAYGADGQIINKREQLWRQRWARAEEILGQKGVVLKSWRVGSDAVKEAERVVKSALKGEKEGENGENGESVGQDRRERDRDQNGGAR